MWNFYVDDSTKSRYDMVLGRNLLTDLGTNLKLSYHDIESDYGKFKVSTIIMVDMGMYDFKYLNTRNITTGEFATNYSAEEIHESEQVHTSTKLVHLLLGAKDEKAYKN